MDAKVNNLNLLANAAYLNSNENMFDHVLKNLSSNTIKLLAIQNLIEANSITTLQNYGLHRGLEAVKNLELQNPMLFSSSDDEYMKPSLCLVCVNDGTKIRFCLNSMTLGKGSEVSLDLSKYSPCTRISRRHALIYYDSVSMRWELLNYCSSGTFVNNCLYGCNTAHILQENLAIHFQDQVLKDFKNIVDKRRNTLVLKRQHRKCATTLDLEPLEESVVS